MADQTIDTLTALAAADAAAAGNELPAWFAAGVANARTRKIRFDTLGGALDRLRGVYNVMDPAYGAKGDGTTDDAAAISAASTAAGIGGRLYFPPGNYYCASGVTQQAAYQTWEGPGFFLGAGGTPPAQLKFSTLSGASVGVTAGSNGTFRNLLFRGPGAAGNTCVGASVTSNVRFDRCQWYSWQYGCFLNGAFYSDFDRCEWSYCRYGVKLTGCYNVHFTYPRFSGSAAIQYQTSVYITDAVKHLTIEGGSTEGYDGNGAFIIPGGSLVNINNMYWESADAASAAYGIVCSGSNSTLNLLGNNVYIDNANRWVGAGSLDGWTIRSKGNKFFLSTTVTAPIAYVLPTNGTNGTLDIGPDDWTGVTQAATYTTAVNTGAALQKRIVPPTGISATFTDHQYEGRSPVQPVRTAAPASPVKGALYWADGATWNPLNRSTSSPYSVVHDGGAYLAVSSQDRIGTAAWTPGAIAAGAQVTTTVAVSQAALGDYVHITYNQDLQLCQLTAYVSAAGVVTVVLRNGTAGPITPAAGTLRAVATRY